VQRAEGLWKDEHLSSPFFLDAKGEASIKALRD
jgi:hypothetical protein